MKITIIVANATADSLIIGAPGIPPEIAPGEPRRQPHRGGCSHCGRGLRRLDNVNRPSGQVEANLASPVLEVGPFVGGLELVHAQIRAT